MPVLSSSQVEVLAQFTEPRRLMPLIWGMQQVFTTVNPVCYDYLYNKIY